MAIKNVIDDADACVDNEYQVQFDGSGPMNVVEFGDIERVVEMADNPDRTRSSGGRTMPGSFPVTVFLGSTEYEYFESWQLATVNKAAGYKRNGVVLYPKGSPQATNNVVVNLSGCAVERGTIPGASMAGDGMKQTVSYAVSFDDIPFN